MDNVLSFEEKLLTKLPPKEMAGRLMALPVRRRLELLLDRPDAAEVTAALPEQDFYLFLKELGEGESSHPLLALAQPEQLNHLLDLECWRRDELMPGKALAWLTEIALASGDKFLSWLYQADFELLVLMFKKWLEVEVLDADEEYLEESDSLPKHTLDDQYYFRVRYPRYEKLLKTLLGYLFENHREFYQELMNSVIGALDTEVIDLAYHFHRGRLEDNAIPDFTEARTIYRPVQVNQIKRNKVAGPLRHQEEAGAPTFALALVAQGGLFAQALAAVGSPALKETLQLELAGLANKVVIADQLDPGEPENLRQSADKVGAYVNLGLEQFSGSEVRQAAATLEQVHLEDLFRLAHAAIASFHSRLTTLVEKGWLARWPYRLDILEPEWQEATSLLLAPTPMILRQPEDTRRAPVEDYIRTVNDLQRAEELVATLQAIGPLYEACERDWLGDWGKLADLLWGQGQIQTLENVTLGSLLFTAAARYVAAGRWQTTPLPTAAWQDLFPQLSPARLEAALYEQLGTFLSQEGALPRAMDYLDTLVARYRTETGSFGTGQLPDPRLVPFFLFTTRKKQL